MARITVEDCLDQVPNRFSLVLVSAERTKQLLKGASPLINNDSDNKEVVTALREIAAGRVRMDDSSVATLDNWKPIHQQMPAPSTVDDELPPEA